MITVLNSFFYDVHNRPKWKSVLANDSSFFMNLQSERIPKRLTVSVNWMSIQGATNSTTHMMTHHNDQLLVIDQSEVLILKFREKCPPIECILLVVRKKWARLEDPDDLYRWYKKIKLSIFHHWVALTHSSLHIESSSRPIEEKTKNNSKLYFSKIPKFSQNSKKTIFKKWHFLKNQNFLFF